ncbi:MAG TPA: hypothetical protein VK698_34050 [Kofleriaceae bacterium]|nr:hypothetical protein [Kofleriaceae bacterium]
MTRTPILVSTLISFTTLFACGGGSKPAEEPQPAPQEAPPEPAAEEPPAEEAPAEPAPAPEPPAPEPKTLSEDLDGDGTPEEISLTGTELSIGEAKVTLSSEKLTAEKAATVELKVIDINKKDKARELVIADPGTGTDATWWIISYDGKAKTASEPVEIAVGTEPEVKGNGTLTISSSDCGQTISTPYKLKKGALTKGKEKKKGKRDETKCAGAAPAEGGGSAGG